MIVLTAIFNAKPDKEEQLETLLKSIVPKVESEPNTIQYALHRSQDKQGCFLFFERYTDKESFGRHLSTPYLKEMLAQTKDLVLNEPAVSFYEEIAAIAR